MHDLSQDDQSRIGYPAHHGMSGGRQQRPPPSYLFHAPAQHLNLRQSDELIEFNGHERLLCEAGDEEDDSSENLHGEEEIQIIRQQNKLFRENRLQQEYYEYNRQQEGMTMESDIEELIDYEG